MTPTLLLTRPRAQSERFAEQARIHLPGVAQVISPIMEIRMRPVTLPAECSLILTSENAVAALADVAGRTAWCVGPRTAEAARAKGMVTEVAGGDARSLIALLLARRPAGMLVHVRGEHRAADIAGAICAAGLQAQEVIGYDQPQMPLTAQALRLLAGDAPVLLPLFSPRSARLAGQAAPIRAPLLIAAISAATATAWTGPEPRRKVIAATPDSDAMLHALNRLLVPDGFA